jgi:hypothetical protein
MIQVEAVGDRELALQSMHDITDRKLWEERQRMLLRDAPSPQEYTCGRSVNRTSDDARPSCRPRLWSTFLTAVWGTWRAHILY